MRIGLHAGHENSSLDDLVRLWKMADEGGFYWVSIWDHIIPFPSVSSDGDCHEATALLALLAHETKNVRVGCLVFCIGFRHPSLLAKTAITLDHMSGGRLELGLGAGWNGDEHKPFGLPFPAIGKRLDMLDEGARIVKGMLAGVSVTFDGEHYQVHNATCRPRPLQTPPRLWIGGAGEQRTLRIAARYADGWNVAYVSPEVYRHKCTVLDGWCETEGRDPLAISRSLNLGFYMGANERTATLHTEEYNRYFGALADGFRAGTLFGTPQAVIDAIGAYADVGVTDLNITMRAPYDFDAMQAFIEEVVPYV